MIVGHYKVEVIEHYPDGGEWHHHFTEWTYAEIAVELLREAHPARKFEIRHLVDETAAVASDDADV